MPIEPPPIRRLPEHVANQIAAGEVVERPAAVVKELVENSLDAGAKRVVVRLEDGGRRLIEVVDDGHGMQPDGMRTALERHATSKLVEADDLFRVATLGFRGEALPSIAAVSECTIASRPATAEHGRRVAHHGDRRQADEAAAMPPGTRIQVRNLFWNVPARLKFLRSRQAETGHVSDTCTRLALAHPQVGFLLESDGRQLFDLAAVPHLKARIRDLLGRSLAENLVAVARDAEGLQLTGFVAHPSQARPTSRRQFYVLNGRPVHDKLLVAAVREGYEGFCEPRLHGAVVLHLDCDPTLVDVNVHPTKHEVRFRRSGEVFRLVRDAVREALEANRGAFELLGGPIARRVVHHPATPPPAPEVITQERFIPQLPEDQPAPPTTVDRAAEPAAAYHPAASAAAPSAIADDAATGATDASETGVTPLPLAPAHDVTGLPAGVRRVTQLRESFLLVETETGLRIIDQHALHEKALYLALDPAVTDLPGSGVQELLVPITVELSAAEVANCEPHLSKLADAGIEADVFGPTTILVRSHPALLKRLDWVGFFADLANQRPDGDAVADLREAIAHRKACRAAVKAGDRLSDAECRELVRLLYTVEGLEHCPHGRPTTLDLSWGELERRFQR